MKNKKVILLILAILAVLTLVSVLVVQKLKKDEVVVVNINENVNQNVNIETEKEPEIIDGVDISDWKTYVNDEYGYSVRYPSDWEMGGFIKGGRGGYFSKDSYKILIGISGVGGEENLTMPFDEYIHIAGLGIQDINSINSIEDIITETGINGYITTWSGDKGITSEKVFFESKKTGFFGAKAIEISYGSDNCDTIEYCVNIRNVIMKTFNYVY